MPPMIRVFLMFSATKLDSKSLYLQPRLRKRLDARVLETTNIRGEPTGDFGDVRGLHELSIGVGQESGLRRRYPDASCVIGRRHHALDDVVGQQRNGAGGVERAARNEQHAFILEVDLQVMALQRQGTQAAAYTTPDSGGSGGQEHEPARAAAPEG